MKSLDTRDLQERLEELEALRDLVTSIQEELEASDDKADHDAIIERLDVAKVDFGDDEAQELKELEELSEEVGSEWRHGVQLIPEDDFEDYARELAEDLGSISKDAAWPACHIDWEAAADSLKMDYSSVTFQDTDYLYRA